MLNILMHITGWTKIAECSVGGLLYVGFSKRWSNKLLCISTQYSTLVDCDNGEITECKVDYDEEAFIAISSDLPNEIVDIYGAHGGKPIHDTSKNEKVIVLRNDEKYSNKTLVRTHVLFQIANSEVEIYNDYGFYTCSFSPCGNYFVLSQDTGITILKKI